MRFTLTIGMLATLVLLPSIADAAPRRRYREERDDYYYPRHEGLMLRGTLGIGGVTADDDLNDITLSGGAAMFSLDIGGALTHNLALHGRLASTTMFEPSISSGGEDFGDLDDTSLTFSTLGLGITYYFPSNLYLTGVLGLSRATFELDGDEYYALDGVGIMGDVGYEWATGGDWGIGVAARIEAHRVNGDDETLSTAAFGILLSVTYF